MTVQGPVLVTGGAGFIGSHLAEQLLRKGRAVRVLDDFSSGRPENLDDARRLGEVEVVRGSILDASTLDACAAGCDTIYHLAVQCVRKSIGQPLANHSVNATGTLMTLETARRHRVRRFIYVSSSEVYGNGRDSLLNEETTVCEPVTVYGGAKLAGEYYTKAYHATYGLPALIVRPFNAYGPREHMSGDLAEVIPRFVIRVRNGLPPVVFGNGENGRDFTYVTEIADAIARAGDAPALIGRVVNLAHGRMVTVRQLADAIAALCGRPDLKPHYMDPRPGDVFRLHADTTLARRELSFAATIDIEQGLARFIKWFDCTYPDARLILEDIVHNWTLPH